MYRLIAGLLALIGFSLGSAWALLNRDDSPPLPPVVAAATVPEAAPGPKPAETPRVPRVDPADVGGYSGTASIRAGANDPGSLPGKARTRPIPPSGRFKATDAQLPTVAKSMAAAPSYTRALECMYAAGDGWQFVDCKDSLPDYPGRKLQTRFQREPDKLAPVLLEAFGQATGVARQNVIFHIALALPEHICLPWLNQVRASTDPEDAEDARCALAFRGDEASMAAFESLALTPTTADCHVIADTAGDHDKLAAEGRRGLLRSYRCIEMLDCKPYFWRHSWAFGCQVETRFPWADEYAIGTATRRAETARRLLPHWIKRFEGHPGSDDMAWRLCQDCREREQWLEAARWASRCATFPDQDMTQHGVRALVTLAETRLERWQIDQLLDGPDFERNRTLLQYIRLRRAAAHEGFAHALREAAVIAASEGDSQIGRCFEARWSTPPAKGIDSGLRALPGDNPLRSKENRAVPDTEYLNPANHWRNWNHPSHMESLPRAHRLFPSPECVRMAGARLARQFRLWETMAELERRRDAARCDDRADLEYKLGAVYYHEPDVIYPCYARHVANSGLPDGPSRWRPVDDLDLDAPERAAEFRLGFASLARAAELFTRLAAEQPNWPGRDKALFSAGMAHIKLANYRPFWYSHSHDIPHGVELFEQLAREHPRSNLADDGASAAAYWRRAGKALF